MKSRKYVIRRVRVSELDMDETPWHAQVSFEVRHYVVHHMETHALRMEAGHAGLRLNTLARVSGRLYRLSL